MGIELCRGLAALMVLMTHYALYISTGPNGLEFLWTGVDLFFVISGFVFAPMLLQQRGGSAAPPGQGLAVRAFFLRRLFRIYPLYLLALIAYWLSVPDAPEKTLYFLRHLFFLHTTSSFEEAYFFNAAFWSLPVEVEFYLLLPLLALLGGRVRWLGFVFVATLLLSLVANYRIVPGGVGVWRILSVHLPTILPEFLMGTLLYYCVQQGQQQQRSWHHVAALAGIVVAVLLLGFGYFTKFGGSGLETNRVLDAPFNFLCACGYALLMYPLLLIPDAAWSGPAARVARMTGAGSYGVYLFHSLSPRILQGLGLEPRGVGFFLLAVALTFLIAGVLYRWYENPLRKFGRDLSRRSSARRKIPAGAGNQ